MEKLCFRKYFILLLMSSLSCFYSMGQSIQGKIIDKKGNPLSYVTVLEKGTDNGVVSDDLGEFTLRVNKVPTWLEVSFIGYATVTRKASSFDRHLTITLEQSFELEEVVLIGSRNTNRTVVNTPVPVDVVDMKTLTSQGAQTSINEILNYVAPSFTSQTQTVSDGTDHLDPASLRSLGPDQVLVLINGKRRHTSALINTNGTVGAGSVGTDMNAIPTAAIERIEVLRDGAAAQYGSDAIAGVVNVVLKKGTGVLDFSMTSGANFSENANQFEGGIDGQKTQFDVNYGLPIGTKGGYINFTGSMATREPALRNKDFAGDIFKGYHAAERIFSANGGNVGSMTLENYQNAAADITYLDSGTKDQIAALDVSQEADIESLRSLLNFDADEDELAARGQTRADYRFKVGTSKLREGKFFGNLSIPVGEDAEFYSFGGISYREGLSAGFYRRPAQIDGRANTPAFPNGFLPHITTNILDQSLAFGIKGKVKEWDVDFSNTYGKNNFGIGVENSSNGTQGGATQTVFDAGSLSFIQNISNLDFTTFNEDVLEGLNIAFGAEYKVENFEIYAGEEASYTSYDVNGNIVTSTTEDNLWVKNNFTGTPLGGGSQVFRGYDPKNATNKYRNSIAAYADIELDFTDQWFVSAAGRFEDFSDFGTTFNYKIASRYSVTDDVSFRGAHSTGFRAPSLHQQYFSKTSTVFVNSEVFEQGTFTNDSRAAKLIGVEKLREETSQSFSLGVTIKPSNDLTITADAYQIDIADRIVYSGSFDAGGSTELAEIFKSAGATSARFFVNAIDTRSKGFEVVISQQGEIINGLSLKNDLSGTFSETEITALKIPKKIVDAGQSTNFFDGQEEAFLTLAQPRTKVSLSNVLSFGKWIVLLRNVYFGEVTDPDDYIGVSRVGDREASDDAIYGAKVVTDLSISLALHENTSLTLGANNLLDIYPDENRIAEKNRDQFVYSRRTSQFGYTGRYLFARVNIKL
ncbi:MAG: TonB-dependent receptor [Wenyingzhuangia sp.]